MTRNESGGRSEDRVSVTRLGDAQSDAGREDGAGVHGDGVLCVLADGAGGVGGAARAAEAVVEIAMRVLGEREVLDGAACVAALKAADLAVLRAGSGGLATGIAIVVTLERVVGASVGDSGAFLAFPGGDLDLTSAQRRRPLLGDGGAIPVAFTFAGAFSRVLVASDGLFKYTARERLRELLRALPLEDAADAMVDCVRLRSGALPDDVSLALIEAEV